MECVLDWKFCQVFGDRNPPEEIAPADIISAIKFDDTGNFIAAGDKGGRVVIFERVSPTGSTPRTRMPVSARHVEYQFLTEFQSHESEFDYLRSLEIDEKINTIKWLKRINNSHMLITTNDKTIKLWKVYEKKVKQSFISSDDLRINLWNLEITNQSFNIVDIKPENMDDLNEVITTCEMHPSHCHHFIYSTSRGQIRLADMRAAALCDKQAKTFYEEEDPSQRTFFSDILAQISDVRFSPCGRYILSRDYLTLKVWDINMENRPLKTIPVHEHLRSKLVHLYEKDFIFDKFECCFSPDSQFLLTGSYGNNFHIFDNAGRVDTCIEASRVMPKKRTTKGTAKAAVPTRPGVAPLKAGLKKPHEEENNMDFAKKVLHLSWHPHQNIIAVGALSNLFIYASI
ncbi:putative Serine/threonine-protein phosphatase 2A 55 kDa regulatory subunit B gamma [Paratrimastix pyriformis]|uniref:Serine/threonine-protein phosphatase 2A 55 kDa regulatory subunit B n=1 Tax=Paratrimastix pyriformis TaxID=342808 RepID=A0ABQ8UQM3_9EUKA|nr:putative Serine/threonine-protein phosphatase 2A 55 kDa regulatory subunit B gamma [Paratrimastix pyriformis]